MNHRYPAFVTVFFLLLSTPAAAGLLEEIVVTAARTEQLVANQSSNVSQLHPPQLQLISHAHINEAMARIAGTWISRGNGQEHLTAIRSPVLTGAGGCGAFLMAQDSISLRAAGFCNVNELFEAPTELAGRIEVIKGPGTVLHGSNAMHGLINVITPEPGSALNRIQLEGGPHEYSRLKVTHGKEAFRIDVSATHDGGYKDDSGFGQQKMVTKLRHTVGSLDATTAFSFSNLNQETAGFIEGNDAYRDDSQQRQNPNPEAFRDARSYRLYSHLANKDGSLNLTPYVRHTDMRFLQHFLPGQPLEENGHTSVGLQSSFTLESHWLVGADVELTRAFLRETQATPTGRSPFLNATIPVGKHYDYDVDAQTLALFAQWQRDLSERAQLTVGLRAETVNYDYDNRMIAGRTQDDGTPCGFGGCRFSRPADRSDRFTNLSPRVGLTFAMTSNSQLYANLKQGFRAPQATELYRLQAGQTVAAIDSEQLDSLEIGVRGGELIQFDLSLYTMAKDNFIFRDANRQSVDNGKTRHRGLELTIDASLSDTTQLGLAVSIAQHQYSNNPLLSAQPLDGNDIDTAPTSQGALVFTHALRSNLTGELEWTFLSSYYTNPENTNEYEGHNLVNLRVNWAINDELSLFGRITNLTDRDYAERADFAFGNERFFVGEPRSVYVGIRWQPTI